MGARLNLEYNNNNKKKKNPRNMKKIRKSSLRAIKENLNKWGKKIPFSQIG